MTKSQETQLSDREMVILKAYADSRGLTIDQAATELFGAALAKRFKKGPARSATVYSINRDKK